jgi:L-aspartate oxidase
VTADALVRAPIERPQPVEPTWELTADVVVVGIGAAGLSAARVVAAAGHDVVVLAKQGPEASATYAAQGGLAAVLSSDDDIASHAADTVTAGAGLCARAPVDALVREAPAEVAALQALGARFDLADAAPGSSASALALGREGGHSRRRIVHARGDGSGAEVASTLFRALAPGVRLLRSVALIDVLLADDGAARGVVAGRVLDDASLEPGHVYARAVVLATGGFGQAWETTSNPTGSTGDGLAAGLRAGAVAHDIEFVQFHPTVLFSAHAAGQRPLVTEALRGEGAVLVDHGGDRVMLGEHPLADLAPRDVVAATMARRMRVAPPGLDTHLLLDATRLRPDVLARFERFVAACRAEGVDPGREPVPVAPGAHYACGGLATDLSGQTTVSGLYAVGEVASTGVHGANRLASNSLTEALASGRRCGRLLARGLPQRHADDVDGANRRAGSGVDVAERRRLAGVVARRLAVARSAEGIEELLDTAASLTHRSAPASRRAAMTLADIEALSLHTVSTTVGAAALAREESRGCHRRDDFPATSAGWQRRLSVRIDGDGVAVRMGERFP